MSKPMQGNLGSGGLRRRRNTHWGLRNDRLTGSHIVIIVYAQISSINDISTCHRRQRLAILIAKAIVRSEEIRKFGFVNDM